MSGRHLVLMFWDLMRDLEHIIELLVITRGSTGVAGVGLVLLGRFWHLRWPHAQIEHVTSCFCVCAHRGVCRGCPKSVVYRCARTHGLLQVQHIFQVVIKIHRLMVFLVHSIIRSHQFFRITTPVNLGLSPVILIGFHFFSISS